MEQDADVQGDSYYDPQLDITITRSGRERWRRRLAESAANRDTEALTALRERLRRGPAATV